MANWSEAKEQQLANAAISELERRCDELARENDKLRGDNDDLQERIEKQANDLERYESGQEWLEHEIQVYREALRLIGVGPDVAHGMSTIEARLSAIEVWQPLDVVLPLADLTSNAQSIPRIPFHAQFLADDAIHFPWYGFE